MLAITRPNFISSHEIPDQNRDINNSVPCEILEIILSKIPHTQVLSVRLVCKRWNLCIFNDKALEFRIKELTKECLKLEKVLNKKIKKAEVLGKDPCSHSQETFKVLNKYHVFLQHQLTLMEKEKERLNMIPATFVVRKLSSFFLPQGEYYFAIFLRQNAQLISYYIYEKKADCNFKMKTLSKLGFTHDKSSETPEIFMWSPTVTPRVTFRQGNISRATSDFEEIIENNSELRR